MRGEGEKEIGKGKKEIGEGKGRWDSREARRGIGNRIGQKEERETVEGEIGDRKGKKEIGEGKGRWDRREVRMGIGNRIGEKMRGERGEGKRQMGERRIPIYGSGDLMTGKDKGSEK